MKVERFMHLSEDRGKRRVYGDLRGEIWRW